jgi:heat shock protein HtpX
LQSMPLVLGAATVWLVLGFLFHAGMIGFLTGAKSVTRKEEPRLYNLLENLCISRGMPIPKLAIMESQNLNAFASGISEKSYAITVTRGLMNTLDDAELEAVLGHELSHILHGDVRLLIISVIFVGMISFLADGCWRMLRHAGLGQTGGNNDRGRTGLFFLIAALVLSLGYLFSLLLRFAISRRREYLADAGAVALTRNPDAMIGALEKISGRAAMPQIPADVRQMFIENPPGLAANIFGLFATHPTIEDRIKALRDFGGGLPKGESVIPKS